MRPSDGGINLTVTQLSTRFRVVVIITGMENLKYHSRNWPGRRDRHPRGQQTQIRAGDGFSEIRPDSRPLLVLTSIGRAAAPRRRAPWQTNLHTKKLMPQSLRWKSTHWQLRSENCFSTSASRVRHGPAKAGVGNKATRKWMGIEIFFAPYYDRLAGVPTRRVAVVVK